MSQANQGNDSDAAAIIPGKPRRGRPRKYPSLNRGENSRVPTVRNLHHGEKAHVPPGFGRVNGVQPHPVQPSVNANDAMVGQAVSGVIEAAFDAGYLINVRVGNSATFWRGVVFKSGRYVPVSAENDVAPGVEMIRRTTIPLPKENYTRAQSSKKRNEQHVASHRNGWRTIYPLSTNLVVIEGKQVQSVVAQAAHPSIARCDAVPVVRQPLHFSNGAPLPNQPSPVVAADLASSKGKHVQMVGRGTLPSNNTTSNLVPPVGNQVFTSQLYTTLQLMPQSLQARGLHKEETVSPAATETHTDSNKRAAGKLKVNDFGCTSVDEVSYINLPLSIEPLQSVQPDQLKQSASVQNRTEKMNELLQVLEAKMENQDEQKQQGPRGHRNLG